MFKQDYLLSQIPRKNNIPVKIKNSFSIGAVVLGLATSFLVPIKSIAQETEVNPTNVTIEELSGDAEEYVGQEITVRSQIEEELDDSSLILQSDEFFGGESILVFNADSNELNRPSDEIPVQVTGIVQQFVLADIESQYGIDLDDQLYIDYENQPAIIANSVALAPTIEDLANNPSAYYNQAIAIEGEIKESFSSNTFALYEDGWIDDIGLLIMGREPNLINSEATFTEGDYVVVTGIVQPFDVQMLQQQPDLGWNEEQIQEFESRYTDRPVISADTIYPSAIDN